MWTLINSSGLTVVEFTSLIEHDTNSSSKVPNVPVEKGGFATYNKVNFPDDHTVMLAVEGSSSLHETVLDKLNKLKSGTELISLVTPIKEYSNLTLESYNHAHRRENGSNLLYVELSLTEVSEVETRVSTVSIPQGKAKNPSDASTTDTGKKQGKKPTSILKDKF